MIMAAIDASHQARIAIPDSAPEERPTSVQVLREFADDYSRARYAAMMADADHRYPDRIRELYLQSLSVPRNDADTGRIRLIAVVFKVTGMVVTLGFIATILLAA